MSTTAQPTVQIAKTVYDIESDVIDEHGQRVVALKRANTSKTLIQGARTQTWTLWSGYKGLPKLVEPTFLEAPEESEKELGEAAEAEAAEAEAEAAPDLVPGRYIPETHTECAHSGEAVVYFSTEKRSAIAYRGRSKKRAWFYSFQSPEQMSAHIKAYLAAETKLFAEKRAAQEERRAFDARAHLEPGDVVVNSWGWEQTNIDFYQVVAVTAKSAVLRPIQSKKIETSSMIGTCTPVRDAFTGEQVRHVVSAYSGRPCISFQYGSGRKWEGKPESWTSYA